MSRFLNHARANLVAYLALFVALGGTSYAAISLPSNSVGTHQLRRHSITPTKLDPKTIGGYVRAWAVIQNDNQVIAAWPRARVVAWDPAFAAGSVSWGSAISRTCFPLVSAGRDFIQAAILPGPQGIAEVHYQAYTNTGQFDANVVNTYIAVLCPEP